MHILNITPERFKIVHVEISDGSEPALRFYILVAVSTLIASFVKVQLNPPSQATKTLPW